MSLVFEICLLVIAALGVASALLLLYGALLTPLRVTEGQRLYGVLTVSGRSPSLEQTVRGLKWLRSNGIPELVVIIGDDGMDSETRAVAERLSRDDGGILLCDKSELCKYIS